MPLFLERGKKALHLWDEICLIGGEIDDLVEITLAKMDSLGGFATAKHTIEIDGTVGFQGIQPLGVYFVSYRGEGRRQNGQFHRKILPKIEIIA